MPRATTGSIRASWLPSGCRQTTGAGFAAAASPGAAAGWAGLTYSQQRQHAESVLAAKKPETRERRVAGIVDALR